MNMYIWKNRKNTWVRKTRKITTNQVLETKSSYNHHHVKRIRRRNQLWVLCRQTITSSHSAEGSSSNPRKKPSYYSTFSESGLLPQPGLLKKTLRLGQFCAFSYALPVPDPERILHHKWSTRAFWAYFPISQFCPLLLRLVWEFCGWPCGHQGLETKRTCGCRFCTRIPQGLKDFGVWLLWDERIVSDNLPNPRSLLCVSSWPLLT